MSENVKQQNWIASFWRRIGALLLDGILLGLVGLTLGLCFESTFIQLGGLGRLIGFGIALVYFSVMNSHLCNGQTIGKLIFSLQVVDAENQNISLSRSLLRYLVLATPFLLNGAHFHNEEQLSILMYPLSIIIFGGLMSIIYLYIFNRTTRQSLHDLVVGTYVVNANEAKEEQGRVWSVHFIMVALLFAISATLPMFTNNLAQDPKLQEILRVQDAISDEDRVRKSAVFSGATTFSAVEGPITKTTYVTVRAFLSSNEVDDVDFARYLATIVIAHHPEANNKDTIKIILTHGYDIGIWSQWSNYTHNFKPKELEGIK